MTSMNTQDNPVPALDEARRFAASTHRLFIGGAWVDPLGGETFATEDPATGQKLGDIALAQEADVDRAVKAAQKALNGTEWSEMKPNARALLLNRLADALLDHADEFAALETLDNGMPRGDARFFHVPYAADQLRYNAGWATKLNGESIALVRGGHLACLYFARTSGRGGADRAVECPDRDGCREDRSGAGGGLRRHPQAGRGNPADGAAPRASDRGDRLSGRRVQSADRISATPPARRSLPIRASTR